MIERLLGSLSIMIKGYFDGTKKALATPLGEVLHSGQVTTARQPLYLAPDKQAMQVSQMLFGEHYQCFASEVALAKDWYLVQSSRDSYIGFMHSPEISAPSYQGNAKVSKLSTALYSAPSMKSQTLRQLPLGAELYIETLEASDPMSHEEYLFIHSLQAWVHADHVQFNHHYSPDPVVLARQFLGQSYLWGGRSGWGCDCSSLVQLCYELCGCLLPRDTDLQEVYMPAFESLHVTREQIQAADLLYWPGHVAIASSSTELIHATRVGMQVVEESIDTVCERILREKNLPLRCILRPILPR